MAPRDSALQHSAPLLRKGTRQWQPSLRRLCQRCYATQTQNQDAPNSRHPRLSIPPSARMLPKIKPRISPYQLITDPHHHHTKNIKVVPSPRSTAKDHPFPLQEWQTIHLQTIDPRGARSRLFDPLNKDRPRIGDTLIALFKTGDPFSGVCLSIRKRGLDTAVLLRNRMLFTGVEMWVKVFSPNVRSLEVVERARKRPRRARLYYMRKPKHDRGSVEGVVEQYMKKRRLIKSGDMAIGKVQKRGKKAAKT